MIKPMRAILLLTLVAAAAILAQTKFGVSVKPGPMDSVLLKDYAPDSSVVAPETKVDKARFPVIDVHTHTSQSHIKTSADVADWVKTMDETGVETTIVFTGATGAEFDRQAELFKPYGKRFQVWCSLEGGDVNASDWPERAARELERCYRKGARGIGELTDKGSGMQRGAQPRAKRLHPDDPRLDAVWKKCAELKIPANVHIADHPSCWKPLGPNQERTPDFQHFNLHGKDVLSYEELLERRNRMLARHRGTTFIACHLGNQGNDLGALGKVLDAHPNLYLDISARDYEIGRQPRGSAKFLGKYQDRVLFGTDMERAATMYRSWWRLLETADEYLPGRIWWRYYGLELPEPVLRKLYRDNALRILAWN